MIARARARFRCALAVIATIAFATHAPCARAQATLEVYHDHGDLVLDVGPTDLPANTMHDMIHQPPVVSHVVGMDGWIHGYRVEIVDSAGNPLTQRLLHHLTVIDPQARELFSPKMLRIAAAGSETGPVNMPRVLGLRVSPTDSLLVDVMLHNPTDQAYHGVHVRVRMPFTSTGSLVPTVSIYPFTLEATPPVMSTHAFDLPPGRSEHYWEGKPAVGGRLLGASGHLHKYGVELRLEDRTAHRVLWSVKPDTDSTGEIRSIPFGNFVWKFGLAIDPDHVYRLTAVYDNPTDTTIVDGGMGILGGVFRLTGQEPWPPVDRTNAEYEYDVKETWRKNQMNGVGMHMPH